MQLYLEPGLQAHSEPKSLRLRITFGGSHRANARAMDKLRPFLASTLVLPTTLGTKRLAATVFDSPAMREALASVRGSVARRQPEYLNAD